MKLRYLYIVLISIVLSFVAAPSFAQDLIAMQAPLDKHMKKLDTLALRSAIEREEAEAPASMLYPEWSNKYAHRESALPDSFRINLRGFHMPCESRVVTSNYGTRWGRMHKGIDIKVYIGDTIRAAFSGKIRVVDYEGKGYGKYVIIRHSNGLETLYGHMSKHLVKEDQMVKAGEPIGLGGNTGRSRGAHLHFETRFLGQFINPERLFNFEMQDVKADYYVYRANGSGSLMNASGVLAASENEEAVAMDKEEESRDFQQQEIAAQKAKPRTSIHKVRQGETLSSIAKKYKTSIKELCRQNGITEKSTLRVGQILKHS